MKSNRRDVQSTSDHNVCHTSNVTVNGASDHVNPHLEENEFIYDVPSEFEDIFDDNDDLTAVDNSEEDCGKESGDNADEPDVDDSKDDVDDSDAYESCDDGDSTHDVNNSINDGANLDVDEFKDAADNSNLDNSSDDDGSDSNAEESKNDTSDSDVSDFSDDEHDYKAEESCKNLCDSNVHECSSSDDDSDSEHVNSRDNWRSSKATVSCEKQKDSEGYKTCADESDSQANESSEDSEDSDDERNSQSTTKNTPSRINTHRGSRSWLASRADLSDCDDSSDNDDDDDDDPTATISICNRRKDGYEKDNCSNNEDIKPDNNSDQLNNFSSFDITESLIADNCNTGTDRLQNPGLDSIEENAYLDDILCPVDLDFFNSSYESSNDDDNDNSSDDVESDDSSDDDSSDDSSDDDNNDELAESQESSDLNLKRTFESTHDSDDSEKNEEEELWDEEDEPMTKEQRLMEVNWKWMKFYSMEANDPSKTDSLNKSQKSVVIALEKNERIPVINEEEWGEDYVAARKGPWLALVADRRRFMQRIKRAQIDIGWVLLPTHRNKILDAALQRKEKERLLVENMSRSTEEWPVMNDKSLAEGLPFINDNLFDEELPAIDDTSLASIE